MIEEIIKKYNDKDSIAEDGLVPSICVFDLRNDQKPHYTIAIPTFLRTELLAFALNSCINQKNFSDFEIIIVDNNPERNDSTEQLIVNNYKRPGIAYFKNEINIGMSGNWNKLYLLSRTDWVVMLHDDDMLYPDFMETMSKVIDQHPQAVCFYSCYNYIHGESDIQPAREKCPVKILTLKDTDFLTGCHVHAPLGMTIKREVVFDIGGFNRDFYPSLDFHFHVKLAHYFPVRWLRGYHIATYRWLVNAGGKDDVVEGWVEKDNRIKWFVWNSSKQMIPSRLFAIYLEYANYLFREHWYRKFNKQVHIPQPGIMKRIVYLIMKFRLGLPKKIRKKSTLDI